MTKNVIITHLIYHLPTIYLMAYGMAESTPSHAIVGIRKNIQITMESFIIIRIRKAHHLEIFDIQDTGLVRTWW